MPTGIFTGQAGARLDRNIFRTLPEADGCSACLLYTSYPGIDYQGQLRYLPKAEVVDVASANEADEELAKLKNTELEALAVCRLIKENLGKPFFDQKLERERPISMRDIAVLMRGVRNYADVFYRIFKENGIESFVDSSEGYFDTMEINVFMNLLSVIDNKPVSDTHLDGYKRQR